MSVVIRDFDIPDRCGNCRLCVVDWGDDNYSGKMVAYCAVAKEILEEAKPGDDWVIMKHILTKPESCPLEEYTDDEMGIWVYHQNPITKGGKWFCSHCNKSEKRQTKFCPECGIKMRWYEGESI